MTKEMLAGYWEELAYKCFLKTSRFAKKQDYVLKFMGLSYLKKHDEQFLEVKLLYSWGSSTFP